MFVRLCAKALYPINSFNPLNNAPLLQMGKLRLRGVRISPSYSVSNWWEQSKFPEQVT